MAWRLEDRGGERFEKYLGDGIDDGFEVVGERKKSAGFTEVTGCMLISHCIKKCGKSNKYLEIGLVTF